MMNNRELRIGNYVNFAEDGVVFKVKEIYIDGLGVENTIEVTYIELDAFEPIPLTEEWLLKFGFERLPDINDYDSYASVFKINSITLLFYLDNFDDCSINGDFNIDLSYVHQLQNLYFALTNEELTYEQ